MKVLVTGANGYLGRGIVKKLLDSGNEVIAVDFTVDMVDKRAVACACDLFAVENPYEEFGKPDTLLHLAWRDGFIHYSDAHVVDLPKHYLFIEKMAKAGIHKIAVMGSMHEIGFFEGSIDEKTSCNPITPYGIAKNALRNLTAIITKQNGQLFQWLRGYYIVDSTSYGSSVFSKLVAAVQEGKELFPFTTGQNQYDFLDYSEFCSQVAATINQDEILGIVNICSGHPEKLADRMERFIKENHYNIQLDYGAFPDRPYDSKAVWGNNKRIKEIMSRVSKTQYR